MIHKLQYTQYQINLYSKQLYIHKHALMQLRVYNEYFSNNPEGNWCNQRH